MNVSAENLAMFEECKIAYEKVALKSKLLKVLVPIAVIVVIAVLVVVYFVFKRKRGTPETHKKVPPKADGQALI